MTASAKVVPPPAKPSESAQPAERDSHLTFTVQPPQMFDRNDLKIEKVAFSKYYICCEAKDTDGLRVVRLYNQSGRLVGQAGSLTGDKIATIMNREQRVWWQAKDVFDLLVVDDLFLKNREGDYRRGLAEYLDEIKDGPGEVCTKSKVGEVNCSVDGLGRGRNVYFDCPKLLGGEASGRYLIFECNSQRLVVDTQEADGKPLEPAKFGLRKDPQDVPFLLEYNPSIDGRPLPNAKHFASHVNGILTITQASDLQRVHADACNGYAVDPANGEKLFYVNPTSHSIVTVDLSQTTLAAASTEETPIPFDGKITDMKFDPVGNFLLFTVTDEAGGNERMIVVEKTTSRVVDEVPGVRGPITLDPVGTIYFVDDQGRLRVVNSNLKTVPLGGMEKLKEERLKKAAKRLEAASKLVLPELPEGVVVSPSANVDQIEDALPKTIQARFKGDIAGVGSLSELDKLEARLAVLKASEEFAESPKAFSLVDVDISSRRQALRAEALGAHATELLCGLQTIGKSVTVATLRDVDAKISALKKERGEVAIGDEVTRREVDSAIGEIVKLRTEAYREGLARAATDLELLKTEVITSIEQAGSVDEVYGIVASERYSGGQALIDVLEAPEVRKSHRESLEKAVEARINQLEKEANAEATRLAERKREAAESTAKLLEKLTIAVAKVSSTAELTKVKSGALMAAVTNATVGLSDEEKDTVQATIAGVLQRAAQKLQTTNQLAGVERGGGEVAIGAEKFPVAGAYSPIVRATVHTDEGSGKERMAFQDGFGRLFFPPDSPLLPPPGVDVSGEWRERAMADAVSYFRSLGRKVPDLRPSWVINRHTVECLEKIIRELRFQRESGQGILILEGEAGTGKNVLIDLLAHLSKHERFLFACNFQTQKEDFTYEYAFTPQKGTFRVSAKLLEKLATPYAFNAFDEINTLPPGVLKMLNALLDERRTLYLPDGREVPVDPTSYLVGFMNPRHYIGTQELSPEIVSRATFVTIPYPPEKRSINGKDLYASDEALMLSRSVRGLSSLSMEEFERAWDAVVNNVGAKPSTISADQERLIKGLHTTVKIANAVRRQYTNFQTNKGTQQMDFVFCLRTGASIARRLRPESNVREVIKEVVLPKISSHESRTNAEMLITTT